MPVNESRNRYKKIIDILKNSVQPLSGEVIAEKLGISRVAVWKILNRLKDEGYGIETTRNGYRLIATTNKPVPWELGDEDNAEYFDELDSTMTRAASLIDSGSMDGTTVIAGHQNSGQTADGGRWRSPEGGLYFTRIRRVPFQAVFCGLYPAVLCLAVAEALLKKLEIPAALEWPCRISLSNKIIGGVLANSRVRNGISVVSAAGFGINLSTPTGKLPESAASLETAGGIQIPARELLNLLLEEIKRFEEDFFSLSLSERDKPAVERLTSACFMKMTVRGRTISATGNKESIRRGEVKALHYTGALELETQDGRTEFIYPGELIRYE